MTTLTASTTGSARRTARSTVTSDPGDHDEVDPRLALATFEERGRGSRSRAATSGGNSEIGRQSISSLVSSYFENADDLLVADLHVHAHAACRRDRIPLRFVTSKNSSAARTRCHDAPSSPLMSPLGQSRPFICRSSFADCDVRAQPIGSRHGRSRACSRASAARAVRVRRRRSPRAPTRPRRGASRRSQRRQDLGRERVVAADHHDGVGAEFERAVESRLELVRRARSPS